MRIEKKCRSIFRNVLYHFLFSYFLIFLFSYFLVFLSSCFLVFRFSYFLIFLFSYFLVFLFFYFLICLWRWNFFNKILWKTSHFFLSNVKAYEFNQTQRDFFPFGFLRKFHTFLPIFFLFFSYFFPIYFSFFLFFLWGENVTVIESA
jgi:hypothetical protein